MYYNKYVKRYFKYLLIISLIAIGFFAYTKLINNNPNINKPIAQNLIDEQGKYSSKDEVALYIHTYNKLPSNYVTKSEAKKMGWVASKGNLLKVCEGCSIGGDKFTNAEGKLPSKQARQYYECDIDYKGGTRNAKRIIYSNDGLIYYTEDHYNTFELLYGEP